MVDEENPCFAARCGFPYWVFLFGAFQKSLIFKCVDTLDTMAENQRRHNERMEEARRATEKIDREIDRLNNR